MSRPVPALFAGCWSEPVLLRIGSGYDDDGETYELYAESVPVAPAGEGGECIFTLLYVTTRHYDTAVSFWLTVLVDGVPVQTERLDLAAVGEQGEFQTHEVGLSIAYTVAGTERLRYAPRGTWFQVLVETRYGTLGGTPAAQIVEAVVVEYEAVRESKSSSTTNVS